MGGAYDKSVVEQAEVLGGGNAAGKIEHARMLALLLEDLHAGVRGKTSRKNKKTRETHSASRGEAYSMNDSFNIGRVSYRRLLHTHYSRTVQKRASQTEQLPLPDQQVPAIFCEARVEPVG